MEKPSGNPVFYYNVKEVTGFSSQHGYESSISYTACNLAGPGNVHPSYGFYPKACAFRTFGDWWDKAPSKRQPFYKTPSSFCSQDYIEFSFPKRLYPLALEIFETYNPGFVVRILACERSADTDVDTGQHNLLRIELCHRLAHWYTSLDYVELHGTLYPSYEEDKHV